MNTLITKDILTLKWKLIYWIILNSLSTLIFFKKFTFLSFFFFDVQLNWLNLQEIFSFFIIYNLSEVLKNWFFFSFLIYYYFLVNYIFFNITFRSSLYKVENIKVFLFFFKFNFIFFFSQSIFKNSFFWFIYTFEENFIKNYFKIELTHFNIENIFCIYLIICLIPLMLVFFFYNIPIRYKTIILNLLLIFLLFIDIIFLKNMYLFIFKLIFFFFLRYIIFFFI